MGMAEALVPADSAWAGKSVFDACIRSATGLTVIGLRRESSALGHDLHDEPLKPGDRMLLAGFWKDILRLRKHGKQAVFLELPQEFDEVLPAAGRRAIAMAILALVVGAMVTGILPNAQAVLIDCLLMGLFLITAILGLFISNTATAILMALVAIAVATELGLSPRPFALTVMIAASTAFMTPLSSPINTLVVSPRNYRFGDIVKMGPPFSQIVMIVTVILVPWLLPV